MQKPGAILVWCGLAVLALTVVVGSGCSLARYSAGAAGASWGETARPAWASREADPIRWPRVHGFTKPQRFEIDGPVTLDARWRRRHLGMEIASATAIRVGTVADAVRVEATPSVLVASYEEPEPIAHQSAGRRGAVMLWTERVPRRFGERDVQDRVQLGDPIQAELATAFLLRLPRAEPKALAVRLTGLDGGIYDRSIERQLLKRGYALLVIRPPALGGLLRALSGDSESGIEQPAWATAFLFDRFFSARALSALGLVEWAEAEVPGLDRLPVVVVASSFGAITAPATTVLLKDRLGDRLRGQALVTGGANLIEIIRTSDLGFDFAPKRSERQRLRWAELYAGRSRFDPLNAAALVRDVPTLFVHATGDGIVPAHTQVILWERLGRPERWDFSGGHVALFLLFQRWAGSIADWVDARLERPDAVASGRIMASGGS